MKFRSSKNFLKDFKNISDNKIRDKIEKTILDIKAANSISDLKDMEKMQGSDGYYRIKIDYRYRIGAFLEHDGTLSLLKVGTREGFYKKFP